MRVLGYKLLKQEEIKMTKWEAIFHRAFRTLVQVAASAAISSIGSASTIGEVNWVNVASTTALAAILSVLMSLSTGLPEVNDDDRTGHPTA